MEKYDPKKQLRPLLLGILFLVGVGALCAFLFEGFIMEKARAVFDRFGSWGLVIGTLITDTSPLPMTSEPVALIGIGANLPIWKVVLIMSATSHIAGPIGYGFGFALAKMPGVKKRLRASQPQVFEFMEKHGVKGVAFAAILPIPYALSTWTAGIVGVSFKGVVLASSLRWVKTPFYVLLFTSGWALGT